MRRILYALGLLGVACDGEAPVAPGLPGPSLRAEVETMFQGWFPLTPPPAGVFNACTGEHVLVSGEFHLIVRLVTSQNGNSHFRVHSQVNVKGVGAVTGTEYIAMEVLNMTEQAGANGSAMFHMSYPLRTVSKGTLENSFGEIRIQLTVNAEGEVVVDRTEVAFDVCRG